MADALANSNTGKAAITQKYLGVDNLGDSDNPLVYYTSQTVNLFRSLLIRRFTMIFIVILNGRSTKLTPIMLTIGLVLVLFHWSRI